ncbi:hypothetical protein BSM4216_1930 [Bacillus smithii]|nr:hypothetical protein BSM4216_1930 [Bacillus smithii]
MGHCISCIGVIVLPHPLLERINFLMGRLKILRWKTVWH